MPPSPHPSSTDVSQWLPRINADLCNGCGLCIADCPTNALGWQHEKAALVAPHLCIYCATCEDICPYGAIELPYLVIIQAPSAHPSDGGNS